MVYVEAVSQRYSITEARANLAAIFDQVERGLEVVLTRRGKPVAVLAPVRPYGRLDANRRGFAEAYRDFLDTRSPDEYGIDDDFAPSVRDKTAGRRVSL